MCEIPNNVLLIDEFAELFDGFSIGSNDLTQLTLGVDRDSAIVAESFDERDPGMLKMLKLAVEGAQAQPPPQRHLRPGAVGPHRGRALPRRTGHRQHQPDTGPRAAHDAGGGRDRGQTALRPAAQLRPLRHARCRPSHARGATCPPARSAAPGWLRAKTRNSSSAKPWPMSPMPVKSSSARRKLLQSRAARAGLRARIQRAVPVRPSNCRGTTVRSKRVAVAVQAVRAQHASPACASCPARWPGRPTCPGAPRLVVRDQRRRSQPRYWKAVSLACRSNTSARCER
jgi:hypothetical protein